MPATKKQSEYPVLKTWPEAETAMEQYAERAASLAGYRAELEEALANTRAAFEADIKKLEQQVAAYTEDLAAFAEAHKQDPEWGEKRSVVHAGVTMGFRLAPPKVRLRRNFLEIALTWLSNKFDDRYVRTKRELNKETLRDTLAAADEATASEFRQRGLTLEQDDNFFVEVQKAE